MKSMHRIVLCMLVLAPRIVLAQVENADNIRRTLIALENAWNQAEWQKDRTALDMLLAPDLIYVKHDGSLMGKTRYISNVVSPSLHPAKIASESMSVHVYGAFAVLNGVYHESGTKNGKPYSLHVRFTDTWMRRNQSWVCVASQSTAIE
jgi:ketosteroid isomerase-like protein